MPETNATSFGCSASSASADLRAAMTPKSPQPGHHHEGVEVAKSLGVSTAAMDQTPAKRLTFAICSTASMISIGRYGLALYLSCLLYTSDAADDLLCVDLGG